MSDKEQKNKKIKAKKAGVYGYLGLGGVLVIGTGGFVYRCANTAYQNLYITPQLQNISDFYRSSIKIAHSQHDQLSSLLHRFGAIMHEETKLLAPAKNKVTLQAFFDQCRKAEDYINMTRERAAQGKHVGRFTTEFFKLVRESRKFQDIPQTCFRSNLREAVNNRQFRQFLQLQKGWTIPQLFRELVSNSSGGRELRGGINGFLNDFKTTELAAHGGWGKHFVENHMHPNVAQEYLQYVDEAQVFNNCTIPKAQEAVRELQKNQTLWRRFINHLSARKQQAKDAAKYFLYLLSASTPHLMAGVKITAIEAGGVISRTGIPVMTVTVVTTPLVMSYIVHNAARQVTENHKYEMGLCNHLSDEKIRAFENEYYAKIECANHISGLFYSNDEKVTKLLPHNDPIYIAPKEKKSKSKLMVKLDQPWLSRPQDFALSTTIDEKKLQTAFNKLNDAVVVSVMGESVP